MPEQTTNPELFASTSPHIRNEDSIPSIMYGVVLALAPATLMGVYFFQLVSVVFLPHQILEEIIGQWL